MSGPFIPAREAQPLDLLEQSVAGGGWESLDEMFKPHRQDAPLQPSDDVAKALWVLRQHGEGRAIIEWLMDITLRAPLRVTGRSIEETALNAAARQGINGVGEVILKAIARGGELMQPKNQNGAGS